MWVNQWTSHQYNLDAETFDGKEEVSLHLLTLNLYLACS